MEIDEKILSEIKEFCDLNGIKNIKNEVHKMLQNGFNIEKYGYSPFHNSNEVKSDISLDSKQKRGRPKKIKTDNISKQEENILEEHKLDEIKDNNEIKQTKRKVRIIKND